MKKLIALMLILTLALSLAACSDGEKRTGSGNVSLSTSVSDLLDAAEASTSTPETTSPPEAAPQSAAAATGSTLPADAQPAGEPTENVYAASSPTDEITRYTEYDVDLTTLSATMVYSEVYDMMVYPENYVGKTIKMEGTFAVYEGADRNYYACIVADAAACCAQGIEFVLADDLAWPGDYPAPDSEVTVAGVFDTYYEDDWLYCQLIDAQIVF